MKTMGPKYVWTRSKDGWLAGVCQGLGESFDINPAMVRLAWLASILFFGFGFIFYFVCAFCFPVAGQEHKDDDPWILGVCSRIAERLEVQPALVRIVGLFLLGGSFGTVALLYVILHFVLPDRRNDLVL